MRHLKTQLAKLINQIISKPRMKLVKQFLIKRW